MDLLSFFGLPMNDGLKIYDEHKKLWQGQPIHSKSVTKIFGSIIDVTLTNYNQGIFTLSVKTDANYILSFDYEPRNTNEVINYQPFSKDWSTHFDHIKKIYIINGPRLL